MKHYAKGAKQKIHELEVCLVQLGGLLEKLAKSVDSDSEAEVRAAYAAADEAIQTLHKSMGDAAMKSTNAAISAAGDDGGSGK